MSSGELNSNQIRGYKSTLARENVSEEAKDHARQVIEEYDVSNANSGSNSDEHTNRVLGGYKATLRNPDVSDQAKDHAQEVLEEAGVSTGG